MKLNLRMMIGHLPWRQRKFTLFALLVNFLETLSVVITLAIPFTLRESRFCILVKVNPRAGRWRQESDRFVECYIQIYLMGNTEVTLTAEIFLVDVKTLLFDLWRMFLFTDSVDEDHCTIYNVVVVLPVSQILSFSLPSFMQGHDFSSRW